MELLTLDQTVELIQCFQQLHQQVVAEVVVMALQVEMVDLVVEEMVVQDQTLLEMVILLQ